jgi:tetratricopeptide (TPR) repeat protein
MLLLVVLAGCGVGSYYFSQVNQRLRDAEAALDEGQQQLRSQAYSEAVRSLTRGRALVEGMPGHAELQAKLEGQQHLARRGQAADQLHRLVDHIRLLYGDESRNVHEIRNLEAHCQKVWEARRLIAERGETGLGAAVEEQIRADLLDLAILWMDLRARLATNEPRADVCRDTLRVLREAEDLLGPSPLLARERQLYAQKLGWTETDGVAAPPAPQLVPQTAWEHFYVGRSLLGAGDLAQASAQFDQALLSCPQDFWSSFYRGQCAYRLQRYEEAVYTFSTCLALMPKSAHCFYNRALARTALGDTAKALVDYDHALQLEPALAAAALNRGILHYGQKEYVAALTDLQRALELGADAATVHYNLALVHLAKGDRTTAVANLRRAQQAGAQPQAHDLLQQLLHQQ